MATICRLVSKTNDATIWADFVSPTGTNNPNSVISTMWGENWGMAKPDNTLFESGSGDGARVVFTRHGPVEFEFKVKFKPSTGSIDDYRAGVGAIFAALDDLDDKALLWVPDGATANRYADLISVDTESLYRGQETVLYKILRQKDDPDGLTIRGIRQPFWRGPALTEAAGTAAQFTAANSEYLSIADNASLSMGDIDCTFAGWVYLDAIGADRTIISKHTEGTNQREYLLYYETTTGRFRLLVSSNGTLTAFVAATTFGAPTVGTWNYVVAWHDATANTINIMVNNGAADSAAHLLGVFNGTSALMLGAMNAGTGFFMNGRGDSVAVWKRTLTAAEKTWLYNAGTGRHYGQIGYADDGASLATSLEAWWNLDETDGTRYDAHGSNDLTDNNTVTSAEGVAPPTGSGGSVAVPNDPGVYGRVYAFEALGDAPAPGVLTVTGDASAKITEVLVARRSRAVAISDTALTDYRDYTHWAQCEATGGGWTVALSGDTAAAVDADGSPGSGSSVAQTSYTSNPTVMAKRVRLTRTTRLDSLRGEFDVYARVKAQGTSSHIMQLRWGASAADPAPMSNAEVTHGLVTPVTSGYIDLSLGRISVPFDATLGGMAFELWSRRASGTGWLNWDVLSFVPVDEMASRIVVEGGASESWTGADLVTPVAAPAGGTAGTIAGYQMQLSDATDNAGTPSNAGRVLASGRHKWTFEVGSGGGVLRVRNITDNADLASYTASSAGTYTIEADIPTGTHASTDLYQEQIDDPSPTLNVNSIIHEFLPTIASTEKARTDAERGSVEKVDTSNALLQDLTIEGPVPALVHPGLNVFYLHYADTLKDNAYEVGESVRARAPTVQVVYSPRYRQP